jgi:hypothetical protein
MRLLATILISVLVAALALAQDELPEELLEEEDIRRYTVEVIIFSYEEDVAVGSEVFPPDEPPEELPEELLEELAGDAPLDEPAAIEEPVLEETAEEEDESLELRFVLLPEEEFTLGDVAEQFELLDVYETIMHFGWTQATYPEEETLPIELRVFGDPPPGLDGNLTLYLSRFLHLVVDLELEAPGQSPEYFGDEPDRYEAPGRSPGFFGDKPDAYEPRTFYRIQEDRIFKSGDIRYFDHPRFGVVAKITRVEEEEEEGEEEVPLLGRQSQ